MAGNPRGQATEGLVLDLGWPYDLMTGFFDVVTRGRLRSLRLRACELAGITEGASVLDVGCGTGWLALEARRRAGGTGSVAGVDPGPRQIARARSKARRKGVAVDFQVGVIERLPFPDASFDAVLCTIMLHHLPEDLKRRGLAEARRVLKPGGRLVIADFMHPRVREGRPAHWGAGETGIQEAPDLLRQAGLSVAVQEDVRGLWIPGVPGAGVVVGRKLES